MTSHKKNIGKFTGTPFRQQPNVPKQELRNCCCLLGDQCKEAQKLCSTFLFSQHLCGYVTLPSDTVVRQQWLTCFNEDTRDHVSNVDPKKQLFALHHFDPDFISNFKNEAIDQNIQFRLPKTVDRKEGILYDFPQLQDQKYYPIPNFSDVEFRHYIVRVESLFVQRMESDIVSHRPYHNMEEVVTNINSTRCYYIKPTKKMIRESLSDKETELLSQFKNNPEISAMKYVQLECDKIKLDDKLSDIQKSEFVGYSMGSGKDGLTRINLVSDNWHEQHPHAAHFFFGFKNWNETKLYIGALFEETEDDMGSINDSININSYNIPMSSFEKVLMTLMRFTRGIQIEFLSYIWLKSTTTIGEYIRVWSPKIGEAGEDLSILDIDESFLTDETPLGYIEQNLKNVAVQVDGKDFMADVPRYNSFFKRAMYSDKVNHSAFRVITWTTKMGLSVEHTSLFCGRCTESCRVAWFLCW